MKILKRIVSVAAVVCGLSLSGVAAAAEVSLISGLYRTQEREVGGSDAGKTSIIDAGGRFSEQLDANMFWFGEGGLSLKSYDAPKGGEDPSDSTSLSLGGGVRYYFNKLAETVSPYGQAYGAYKSEKEADMSAASTSEKETSGLFYGADFGIRFSLSTDFFVDFETQLFESALFATEETETTTVDPTDGKQTTKEENSRTELYVNSTGALSSFAVAVGMRL